MNMLEEPGIKTEDKRRAATAALALAAGLRRFVGLPRLIAADQLNQFMGLGEPSRNDGDGPQPEDASGLVRYGPAQESFDRLLVPALETMRRALPYEVHRERAARLRLYPADPAPAGLWYANPLLASMWCCLDAAEICRCHSRARPLNSVAILGDRHSADVTPAVSFEALQRRGNIKKGRIMFRAQRMALFVCLCLLSACAGVQPGEGVLVGGDLGSGRAAGDGLLGSQPINSNLGDCELRDECPEDDVVTGAADQPPGKRFHLLMEGFLPLQCGPEVALQTWNVNEDDGILRGLILPNDEEEPVAETSTVILIDYGPEFRGGSPCDFASFDAEVPKNFEHGLPYQVTTTFHGGFALPLNAVSDTLLGVLVLNAPHRDGSFVFTSEQEYRDLLAEAEWVGAAKVQRVPAEE